MDDSTPPPAPIRWPAPASPGDPLSRVDTPALVLDLDAFERNLARMAGFAAQHGLRLRPHAKMHKTPAVALAQMRAGAVGVCCQKASEAEVFVDAGVGDVLITNQVVGAAKLARVAALARRARVGLCFDDAGNVAAAGAAARDAGVVLDAYVEIDVGARRCGVAPGAPASDLAAAIAACRGLRLAGLQAYHGSAQHLREPGARAAASGAAAEAVRQPRAALRAAGLPCDLVTGAGTGSFEFEAASGVWGELQPGSYAFMDADYGRNQCDAPFEHSLTLLTTVMSRGGVADGTAPERIVVDAGLKAHAVDSGPPTVAGDASGAPLPGLRFVKASDEHSVIAVAAGTAAPALGARIRLVPGHIDPTVNLHDWIVCVRGTSVAALWPVAARGALW
ncbi:MAG: DSD1 family PLP-dependent enzyme [Burkholderiales bacterium]|nr:DSD1 family PLP-dependent enzyme [Burkholderiales bacterium]